MSAREYLNETGLASLWTKIVNKINALGDLCVKKAGDIMTGNLTIAGHDLILGTQSSSSDDSGDIVWQYGNGNEKARIWTDDDPITGADGRLNFRAYNYKGDQVLSTKIPTKSDVDTKLSKTGDTASGLTTFAQGIRIQAGSQGTNPPFFLCLLNQFAQGGDVGWTNTSDMATVIGLSTTIKNKTVTDATSVHKLPGWSANNIPTTRYLAYWDGAHDSSNHSNLRYTAVGSLGAVATMSKGLMPDGAGAHGGRIAELDSSGGSIAQSGLRYNFLDWGSTFIIDCKASDSAIGMVIATNNSTWSHYYIQKGGSGAAWQYTYNSAISSAASTYPQMTSSNVTINGIAYTRATFKSRDNSSYKFYAVWVKSSTSGG